MSTPAISLAAGLRNANWPMVAEFMEPTSTAPVAVYVSTEHDALALCAAIKAIPRAEGHYSGVPGASVPLWRVMRRR